MDHTANAAGIEVLRAGDLKMAKTPSEREMLAIAFLTGQSTVAEKHEFKALVETDPQFRTLVGELEAWLAPLDSADPDPARLDGLLEKILEDIPARLDSEPETIVPTQAGVHRLWRPAALIAAACAIAALVIPAIRLSPATTAGQDRQPDLAPSQESFVAALSDTADAKVIVIVYDPAEQKILARFSNVSLPVDGVWQLWLIRDDLPAPRSLGIFAGDQDGSGKAELALTNGGINPEQSALAISLEPLGGSRQKVPSGPILYQGSISNLS